MTSLIRFIARQAHKIKYRADHASADEKKAFYTIQNYHAELAVEILSIILVIILLTIGIIVCMSTFSIWMKILLNVLIFIVISIISLFIVACGYDLHLLNMHRLVLGLHNNKKEK